MGTKKYPCGECILANTSRPILVALTLTHAQTHTNYYFDVTAKPSNDEEASASNPSPLSLAPWTASRSSSLSPCFWLTLSTESSEAVDSENKKNLQSDQWRLNQLEKSMSNPRHPYSPFFHR